MDIFFVKQKRKENLRTVNKRVYLESFYMKIILVLLFFSACAFLRAEESSYNPAETPIESSSSTREGVLNPSKMDEDDRMFYTGVKFYGKGDYLAAFALFREISPQSRHYLQSLYLSANIGSIEGGMVKDEVYLIFEKIFKNPDAKKNNRIAAALQFARFARANGDFEVLSASLKEFLRHEKLESEEEKLLSWHLLDANCRLALKNVEASGNLVKMALENLWILFRENCENPDSLVSDMVLYTALGDSDYVHAPSSVSMSVAEKDKLNSEKRYVELVRNFLAERAVKEKMRGGMNDAYSARMALALGEFTDENFSKKQSKLSLYAQINLKNCDIEILENRLKKTPFVDYWWRASYIVAKHYFNLKNYNLAAQWAMSSSNVAPVEMNARWKVVMLLGDALRMGGNSSGAKDQYMRISECRKCKGAPSAEALYKIGLIAYDAEEWAVAYKYFERVFIAYFHFEYWGSRSYYWAAMCHKELGDNAAARSVLVEYFRRAKDRQSKIYTDADRLSRALVSGN